MSRILITGGAGFVGSNLAVSFRQDGAEVTCLDNLSRRGSEILQKRILDEGCSFVHGDIRNPEDLSKLKGDFDLMVECSAEPSVLVGTHGDEARFMINNNLIGSVNCFEFARTRSIPVIFLSTSRVYPYDRINSLQFSENGTRFLLREPQQGASANGIATDFPLNGYRSLYGASKLASELILQEYSGQYQLPSLINRFGVIAGPWQLGKVDQGIFTFWLAKHYFNKSLQYIGFGGQGKQVRDLLHVADAVALIKKQAAKIQLFRGEIFNAGGSSFANLSLQETTSICQQVTGNHVEIGQSPETRPADVKWFVTDNGQTEETFNWRPEKNAFDILSDTYFWLRKHETEFKQIFGG